MPVIAHVNSSRNIRSSLAYGRDSVDSQGRKKSYDRLGINCSPDDAIDDFQSTQRLFDHLGKGVQLKRFVISFGRLDKENLNPEEVHRYMNDFLHQWNQTLGSNWQMVAYSHINTEYYHFHVYVNNVNLQDGQKLSRVYNDVGRLRKLENQLTEQYQMNPVQKQHMVTKDMGETKTQTRTKQKYHRKAYSFQDHVRTLISKSMLKAKDWNDFKSLLHKSHASLRPNFTKTTSKHGTINIPSFNEYGHHNRDKNGHIQIRKVRTDRLGEAFDKHVVIDQLKRPLERRDSKYMDVYRQYQKTLDDVNLNAKRQPLEHTERYLATDYVRDNHVKKPFQSGKEVNDGKELELIRTVQKLNRKFATGQTESSESERTASRFSPAINRDQRAVKRAKAAIRAGSGRNEDHQSHAESIRRAKQAVDRAKRRIRSIPTGPRRKPTANTEGNASSKSSSGQNRQVQSDSRSKETSSKRERPTSPGQRAIKLSFQRIRITDPHQKEYSDEDKRLLPEKKQRTLDQQQQSSQGFTGFIQRAQRNIKHFEETKWEQIYQAVNHFYDYFGAIYAATQSIKRFTSNIARSIRDGIQLTNNVPDYYRHPEKYRKNPGKDPSTRRLDPDQQLVQLDTDARLKPPLHSKQKKLNKVRSSYQMANDERQVAQQTWDSIKKSIRRKNAQYKPKPSRYIKSHKPKRHQNKQHLSRKNHWSI